VTPSQPAPAPGHWADPDDPSGARTLGGAAVAVVVVRSGRLPGGADEAVAEAGGRVVVIGPGATEAVEGLASACCAWLFDADPPAGLGEELAAVVGESPLVVLPASPDGRDLAPRLAAALGRPLLAGCTSCRVEEGGVVASLLRTDGQVTVTAAVDGPAVATLWPGTRPARPLDGPPDVTHLDLSSVAVTAPAVVSNGLIEPDPATMDLADAERVLGGGAGLVRQGASDDEARAVFGLLVDVAAALGASAGATRVVTDAGWMSPDRQIGTTGVTLNPHLYVALGVSGATQHTGGLGDPEAVVSVNLDPASPMTAMADLGVVADAPGVLIELAGRLGVEVPAVLRSTT
jgi:electron transfer flavoprotein alpha subunit